MAVEYTTTWVSTDIATTGTSDINSTSATVAMLDDGGGGNMLLIVYVLLGVGALTPIVLLLIVAIVLRSRRASRHAVRRRATYNSAPAVDVVTRAWNSPVAGPPSNTKLTSAGAAVDATGSRSNLSADGGAPATLSELAVREFFDVPDHHQARAGLQLYVSVDPTQGSRRAPTPGTAESSTPGGYGWTSGSESSGTMERQADDLVALIGPKNSAGSAGTEQTLQTTKNHVCDDDDDDLSRQCAPSSSTAEPTNTCSQSAADDGPCALNDSTVQTVVADVEQPPVNGLAADIGSESDDDGPPLRCLSKMHRSEACYDIAQLSKPPPSLDDSPPCGASSKSSTTTPLPAPCTTISDGSLNGAESEPIEDLTGKQERVLKCLDAVTDDYDNDEDDEVPEIRRQAC